MSSRVASSSRLLFGSSAALFLCAALYAFFATRTVHGPAIRFLLLLLVPGGSTMTFMLVASLVPSIIPERPFGWPLNMTLPAVFGGLMQLWALMASHGPNPIVKHQAIDAACHYWQHFAPALWVFAFQVLVLSGGVLANRGRMRTE